MPPSHLLLAASRRDLAREGLAQALAGLLGETALDASMRIRRGRGVLAERLSPEEARRAAAALREGGFGAVVLDAEAYPPLPPLTPLARLEPVPEGLRCTLRPAGEETVGWGRLVLLAAAPVRERTVERVRGTEGPSGKEMALRAGLMAATGVPMGLGKRRRTEKAVVKRELHLHLDLALRDPPERLRVDTARFDWSGLGEAMGYQGLANARALLLALEAAVPAAARNEAADLLLSAGRLSAAAFDSLEEFEREERWLLAVGEAPPPRPSRAV